MRLWKRWKRTWQRMKRTLQLTLNERQIAAAIRLGITIGVKRERAEAQSKPFVVIDPVGQKQSQSQIGTYEPPEKRTDPAQFSIRRRAMTRQLQENHQYMHHHHAMLKKVQTVKLDPETMNLPSMTAPEDDWTNGGIDKTLRTRATKP